MYCYSAAPNTDSDLTSALDFHSQRLSGKDDKSQNNFSWKWPTEISSPSPHSRQRRLQNQIQVLRALSSSEYLQPNVLLSLSPSHLPSPAGGQLAWGTTSCTFPPPVAGDCKERRCRAGRHAWILLLSHIPFATLHSLLWLFTDAAYLLPHYLSLLRPLQLLPRGGEAVGDVGRTRADPG